MKQKQNKTKTSKPESKREESNYKENYDIISVEDRKKYKSGDLSIEIIDYKL